ncbi:MAG: tRNA lysidine(34) synthetase TilS [Anaerovoracaceae bacterium]
MVKNKVRETIVNQNLIEKGDHIVIGLSGGPDSVCLFYALKELSNEFNLTIYPVHVNHKFRKEGAEADEQYVENLCVREETPCHIFTYDCPAMARKLGLTSEEAGRKARYEAFGQVAQELMAAGIPQGEIKIAVAQNANDQGETLLMRIIRGTGTDGLAGIPYSRGDEGTQVIRPLLDVYREDIETYCEEHQLNPRIDETNLKPVYTRNKVRLELIPYIQEEFNQNIVETLNRLGKIAREDKEYIWEETERAYTQVMNKPGRLDKEKVKNLHTAIRHRVILKAFSEIGLTQDITAAHLEDADSLISKGETSKTKDFPNGYALTISYDEIVISKRTCEKKWHNEEKLKITIVRPENEMPKGCAAFDLDKIKDSHGAMPVVLRTRIAGDYIGLKNGHKKIQDFFVDQKIPREERDNIYMAAIGGEILWVILPGQSDRYSEKYKLCGETKKVMLLEKNCVI